MLFDKFRSVVFVAVTEILISEIIRKVVMKETADLHRIFKYFVRTVIHLKYYQRYDLLSIRSIEILCKK
jgi:hypothetical protein